MKEILVVGGGFAGVWSAAGAARAVRTAGKAGADLRVRLISNSDDLVIRPRLYEPNPDKMRVSLDMVLGPIGVDRLNAHVQSIEVETRTVTARTAEGQTLAASYDRLILATGSQLIAPELPGAANVFNVDTLDAAVALDRHLHQLAHRAPSAGQFSVVVVGAGFTGLEIATELGARLREIAGSDDRVRVVLVERADVPGPELGEAPRPFIAKALDDLRIEQRLGRTLASASAEHVVLSDGEVIPAATVIWTVGMAASPLTTQIPVERDRFGRLPVDQYLRVVGIPGLYAAGDTAAAAADDGHTTIQSCQHALPMGKFAGYNATADLIGLPQLPFRTDPYSNAIDLGAAGAVTTTGWDRIVKSTGSEAKSIKQDINTKWIYPPTDSAEAIFAAAGRFGNSA